MFYVWCLVATTAALLWASMTSSQWESWSGHSSQLRADTEKSPDQFTTRWFCLSCLSLLRCTALYSGGVFKHLISIWGTLLSRNTKVSRLTPGSCRARCRPATSGPAWRSPPWWSRRCPPCLTVHSTTAQVCHSHTLGPSLPRCCCSKLDSLEYAHSTFWPDTETQSDSLRSQEHLPLLSWSSHDSPQGRGVGWLRERWCNKSVVRGEGDDSVSTGRVYPHYWEQISPLHTRHHHRVTWRPATTL